MACCKAALRLTSSLLADPPDLLLNRDGELVTADSAHPRLVVVVAAALLFLLPLPHNATMERQGCYLTTYSGTNLTTCSSKPYFLHPLNHSSQGFLVVGCSSSVPVNCGQNLLPDF